MADFRLIGAAVYREPGDTQRLSSEPAEGWRLLTSRHPQWLPLFRGGRGRTRLRQICE